MKKISLLSLLFTVVTSMSILSSCSDSPDMPVQAPGEQPAVEEIDPEVAFYPKAAKNLKSRSQRDGFWEDIQEIYLNGGRLVPTPWNKNGTTSSVPSNILKDIEYDKGWDLIYYPVGSNGRLLMDYLVFHNRYTGILKGFCFYEGG